VNVPEIEVQRPRFHAFFPRKRRITGRVLQERQSAKTENCAPQYRARAGFGSPLLLRCNIGDPASAATVRFAAAPSADG
jgi:hypothetical protein